MFETMTSDKAYILGFICADGCNEGYDLSFQLQNNDTYILEKIKAIFDISGYNSTLNPNSRKVACSDGFHYYSRLRIYGKRLCRELDSIGITKNKSKTLTMILPSNEFLPDFIRGFLDGDGHIFERRKSIEIEFYNASLNFMNSLSEAIGNLLNIKPKIPKRHDTVFRFALYGYESYELCKLMYFSKSDLWLKRKRDIFINYKFVPSTKFWTDTDIDYLKNNYVYRTGIIKDLSLYLKRSQKAVAMKLYRIGILKHNFKYDPPQKSFFYQR
jgi:LAGLIDADG-like domain